MNVRFCAIAAVLTLSLGAAAAEPVKVTVKDGKAAAGGEPMAAVDLTPRVKIGQSGGLFFGLMVDDKLICCTAQASIWSALRVDGQIYQPGPQKALNIKQSPLAPGPFGRKRIGTQAEWQVNKIQVTQVVEVIASRPDTRSPGQKRRLDTCRISYLLHNQGELTHKVDYRTSIDILIVRNDSALFAAPTTHPGQVLNGVRLEDKTLPEHLLVLERPVLADPGFVATMTLKHAKGHGPNRVVLSNLGVIAAGQQVWDLPAQPAGDSACALYWNGHELRPGEKRELVWAYGGGRASDPDSEGRVQLALGGSFEPNKLFTITATIDDPVPSQVLTLELPPGLERVEGRAIEPVPLPGPDGSSAVLWKARVLRLGDYEIKVHSSTGAVLAKELRIEAGTP